MGNNTETEKVVRFPVLVKNGKSWRLAGSAQLDSECHCCYPDGRVKSLVDTSRCPNPDHRRLSL